MTWGSNPEADPPWGWHTWFAWRPVRVEGRWTWLRLIQRRLEGGHRAGLGWRYKCPGY
jgi:hypothetical protein